MNLSLFTRASDGSLTIASYHPRKYTTWVWALSLTRRQLDLRRIITRPSRRTCQWHSYLKLPFGYALCLSRQDYHRKLRHD